MQIQDEPEHAEANAAGDKRRDPNTVKSGRMLPHDRAREGNLRQIAAKRGFRLEKSLRSHLQTVSHGGYMLIDTLRNTIVYGDSPHAYAATLDEIEAFISPTEVREETSSPQTPAAGQVQLNCKRERT